MKRMNKRVTKEMHEGIRKKHAAGWKQNAIAGYYGINKATVSKHIHMTEDDYEEKKRKTKIPRTDIEAMIELFRTGQWTIKDLAFKYGVSVYYVNSWVSEYKGEAAKKRRKKVEEIIPETVKYTADGYRIVKKGYKGINSPYHWGGKW